MIDIKTIAVPKKSNNGGTSTTIIKGGGGSSGSNFDPHYLWGQYFDDTEDINGDLTGVGSITAKGEIGTEGNIRGNTIYAKKVEVEEGISVDNLDVKTLNAEEVNATNVNADVTNTTKLEVGDKEKGQWIIEEDENVDLHVHIPQDETFRVRPNDVDVFDVSQDKVHISTKLDLTNSDDGTNVSMGKSVNDKKNTNIKSIVEEGFYFTDSENNVAIGIGNNYIQMGIDMGSPNFFAGSYGWRVQPDGTAEFQNLKVDGNLDVYVITYNEMRATNGILLVTDVGCITDVIDNTIGDNKYWIFTISEFPPFAIDDYVLLQYKVDETRILSFKGIVTAINEDGKNTVRVLCLSGFEGQGTSNDDRGVTTFRTVDPETASGQYLIRIGNKSDANRQTIIKLNPYDGGYIDFMKGLNNENFLASEDNIKGKLPTACRIGNLSGVTYKGTTLEGYGLYADNAYLTGAIKNLENTWSLNEDGSGNVAGNHITWDKDGNLKIMLGDKELNSYISEIYNDLDGKITTTKTELSAEITATAEALTSDYNKKITDTTTDLEGKINTTKTELEGKITQTADSLTSDYTKKITETETDINGKVNKKVTELEGKITQSAESLQSDYNKKITDVDGKITTAESNFTQTANSISSRVKSIEDDYVTSSQLQQTADSITAKVGNFDVGATNLLQGTKKFKTSGTNLSIKNGSVNETVEDFSVLYYSSNSNNSDMVEWTDIRIEPSTYYTLSFYAKGSGTIQSFFYHAGGGCIAEGYNSQGNKTTGVDGVISSTLTDTYKKYWITWKTKSSVGTYERCIPVRLQSGSNCYLYGCKLERGNVVTDWSPSPKDNDNGFATQSELTVTADSISGRVTAIENDYVKSSEITQNADNIKIAVYDELKNKTGIDVQTGRIIIDADNTEFTGNIELKKTSDVLTVLDDNGQNVIRINNGYVSSTPQVQKNYIDLTSSYSKYSYGESINPYSFHYINNITKYDIGEFSTSDTIKFEDRDFSITVASTEYENGFYDFPSYNYNDGGSYTMTISFYQVSGSTTYSLYSETVTNKRHFTTKSFKPSINGNVYADISIDFDPNRSTMTSKNMNQFISEILRFNIYKYPKNLTTIGRNGLSVINNADAYMSFTDEGLKIGAGDYVLVANNTDGLAYNTKGYLNTGSSWNTPIGCPIYNNIWDDSMMKDCVINSEDGTSAITVKGYEVDTKVVNMIHITGKTANNLNWRDDTNYWIILPYAESTMVYIKNSSDKNMRIYSRGVSSGSSTYYSKNIYINQEVGTRNTGRYYFELEAHNTETLILYATRNGWFNIRPIG